MKTDEKVMAEWPAELRDDAQKLTPLPSKGAQDFVIVRFRGANNKASMAALAAALQTIQANRDDVHVSYAAVEQHATRWQPKNSYAVLRGAFDWVFNHGRAVLDADALQVAQKKDSRDARRRAKITQ